MRWLGWLAAVSLTGCAAQDLDTRDAQLVRFFEQDNRVWLRDPELLARKFDRMERTAYDFMRGSAGLMVADVARQSEARTPTTFVQSTDAANVLILGDPHPENFGTSRWADGTVSWEFVDLDGTHYGPFQLDLRRGIQGLFVLLAPLDTDSPFACRADCRADAAAAFVQGYVDALEANAPDDNPGLTGGGGPFLQARWEEALEEGGERKRTARAATNGRFVLDEAVDAFGGGRLAVPADEAQLAADLLDSTTLPAGARRLDIARIYGRGVSSHAAFRYEILWDTGDDADTDDQILEVREVVDTAVTPRLPSGQPQLWDNLAHRLTNSAARLWTIPEADPRFDAFEVGGLTFRQRSRTSWFQGFAHDKFVEEWNDGDGDRNDLMTLAASFGAMLANAHIRGQTGTGGNARDAIRADIAGRTATLITEQQVQGEADLARLLDDHARFGALRESRGPLLGIDAFLEYP